MGCFGKSKTTDTTDVEPKPPKKTGFFPSLFKRKEKVPDVSIEDVNQAVEASQKLNNTTTNTPGESPQDIGYPPSYPHPDEYEKEEKKKGNKKNKTNNTAATNTPDVLTYDSSKTGVSKIVKGKTVAVADGDTITVHSEADKNDVDSKIWDTVNALQTERGKLKELPEGSEGAKQSKFKIKNLESELKKQGYVSDDGSLKRILRIRLRGIDAPESSQQCGKEAGEFMKAMVLDSIVSVHIFDTDRYGRTVADVITSDGRNTGHELLKAGLAWHYKAYDKRLELATLEQDAKKAQRGLWASQSPLPPWEYRRMQKH